MRGARGISRCPWIAAGVRDRVNRGVHIGRVCSVVQKQETGREVEELGMGLGCRSLGENEGEANRWGVALTWAGSLSEVGWHAATCRAGPWALLLAALRCAEVGRPPSCCCAALRASEV